jgi:hypothetical protein
LLRWQYLAVRRVLPAVLPPCHRPNETGSRPLAQGAVLAENRADEGPERISLKGQAGLLISLIVE